MKFFLRLIAVIVVVAGIGLAGYAAFRSSDKADEKQVFADRTMLAGLWNSYKNEYWEASTGRTIDKQQNDITTSEGQSYTMLRAVWQGDKDTFDKAWDWTQGHIQRQDKLFSWRWGKKSDGTYGILTDQSGQNTASDADSDIAVALLMAASRWQQQSYLDDAKGVVSSMWNNEVAIVAGKPYFVANDIEKLSQKSFVIVNPSYVSPYAYRLFAAIDKTAGHDWSGLVGASYDMLDTAMTSNLNVSKSADLVPDWINVARADGTISAPTAEQTGYTTNYGFEAFRTPWRLALDYQWNKEPRAKELLSKMSFLSDEWKAGQTLSPVYSHDGVRQADYESSAAYGGDIGYFMIIDPTDARAVYDSKLKHLYDPNKNTWTEDISYYNDNWAWFGMALYTGALDNLAGGA